MIVTAPAAETAARAPSNRAGAAERIASLDVLRGAVMVLMALDHVRIFVSDAPFDPLDLSRTTSGWFLTRWVTHFCAPLFIFLAGTGAYLYGQRRGKRGLAWFLLTRGAWLLLIEMTLARVGWTFNFDYGSYLLAGVIWVIGWCMIVLAGLVFLPHAGVAALGLAIVGGHNVLDGMLPGWGAAIRESSLRWLWQVLYLGGPIQLGGGPTLFVLYSIVPWIGVMACGYAFGPVMRWSPALRTRFCLVAGGAALLAFVVLRGWNLYGDARAWSEQSSWLFSFWSMLNTRKYPASLLFLLMTLGPMLLLIPAVERAARPATCPGWVCGVLRTFGRTPFFYYILHLPVIHLAAVALSVVQFGAVTPWLMRNHPIMAGPPPEGWGVGLVGVYAITFAVVALLYWPCRWMAGVKDRSGSAWLSFL